MSKNTKNQKVIRVVRFLMGLRNAGAYVPLSGYGLTEEVLAEAQELLRQATTARLDQQQVAIGPPLLPALDHYENHWFRVIRATLKRHHPEVHDWVFNNIAQTRGVDLVVSVDTVVRRLREIETGASPFGDQGEAVMALLAERGFSAAVLEEGENLLQKIAEFKPAPVKAFDPEEEARDIDKLWAWYLEWSEIARNVIVDRRVLRSLGFLNGSGERGASEQSEGESETTESEADQSGTFPAVDADGSTDQSEEESRLTGTESAS